MADALRHNKPWTNEEKYLLLNATLEYGDTIEYHKLLTILATIMCRIPTAIGCRLRSVNLVNDEDDRLVFGWKDRARELIRFIEQSHPGIQHRTINFNKDGTVTVYEGASEPAVTEVEELNNETKEYEMKVEVKHFLNGRDIAGMSDDELFAAIAAAEKEIAKLEEVQNKPKRMELRIQSMKDNLKSLIDHLNKEDEVV